MFEPDITPNGQAERNDGDPSAAQNELPSAFGAEFEFLRGLELVLEFPSEKYLRVLISAEVLEHESLPANLRVDIDNIESLNECERVLFLAAAFKYFTEPENRELFKQARAAVNFRQVQLCPGHFKYWEMLGSSLASLGYSAQACTAVRKAIELGPQEIRPRLTLASILALNGDSAGASEVAREALQVSFSKGCDQYVFLLEDLI